MDHPDVVHIMHVLSQHFLQPDVQWFNQEDLAGTELEKPGWYHRLSAPGYLDCTDWTGPFDCEEEANSDLCDMYGDDVVMPPREP